MLKATLLTAAAALFTSTAFAAPIITGAGNETCNGGPCYVQNVVPAWQAPYGGAEWLAPKPAGVFWPAGGSWTYEQTFDFDTAQNIDLTIWADDFARVLTFNGVNLALSRQASFDTARSATVQFTALAGLNTIQVEVYPRGLGLTDARNPTGILINGTAEPVEASPVPIPAALPLMAGAVALLAYKGRRKA